MAQSSLPSISRVVYGPARGGDCGTVTNRDAVALQEADVAVTLGLVALRINELGERLFAKLAQLTEVLGAAGAALQHWGPVFQQAASAVQAAEHAHEQAVSHQVCTKAPIQTAQSAILWLKFCHRNCPRISFSEFGESLRLRMILWAHPEGGRCS